MINYINLTDRQCLALLKVASDFQGILHLVKAFVSADTPLLVDRGRAVKNMNQAAHSIRRSNWNKVEFAPAMLLVPYGDLLVRLFSSKDSEANNQGDAIKLDYLR